MEMLGLKLFVIVVKLHIYVGYNGGNAVFREEMEKSMGQQVV